MLNIPTIAGNTFRQTATSGQFWLIVFVGVFALTVLRYIPFFTFKEDVKMFKDVGCALILTLTLVQVLMAASRVIDEEFENRTAVTLLSKPVRDYELLLGKFLGVLGAAFAAIALMSIAFEIAVYWRLWDDDYARRRGTIKRQAELDAECWLNVWTMLPCLVLVMLQTTVMTAVATSLSTRLPLVPNMLCCVLLFVVGHLTPLFTSWTEYELDAAAFQTLRNEGVSEQVLAKLEPVRNRRFADEAELSERLDKALLLTENDRHKARILELAAGWAARSPVRRAGVHILMVVLPDLERAYNVIDAVAYQQVLTGNAERVPDKVLLGDVWMFTLSSAVYTVAYTAFVLLLGLAMLRRREVTI